MKPIQLLTFLSFLFFSLLVSPLNIYAQVETNVVKNKNKCPSEIREWNKYKIDASNWEDYGECIEWLKTIYMQDKKLSYMNQSQMKKILLDRYEDIIKYYKDPEEGFDLDEAIILRKESNKVKIKEPKKEDDIKNNKDDNASQKRDDGKKNNGKNNLKDKRGSEGDKNEKDNDNN